MELITIYFIALAWCGLGMVGAQMAYNWYYNLWSDMPAKYWIKRRDRHARWCFIWGLVFGPIAILEASYDQKANK